MKKFTKTLATTMAAAMLATCTAGMATSFFASAEETTYTITMGKESTSKDDATHTYEAYQIFTGDLSDSVLSNIQWGTGVDGSTLLTALTTNITGTLGTAFASCTSAADVADVLATNSSTAGFAEAFADFITGNSGAYLTDTKAASAVDANDSKIKLSNLAAGYYLVQDAKDSPTQTDHQGAKTKYILKVVKNTEATIKSDVPTIDKQVYNGTTWADYNTASVGDTVTYKITATLPDDSIVSGYESYYLEMTDNLSSGLTFKGITSVKGYKADETLAITYNAVGAAKAGSGTYANTEDQTYKLDSASQSAMKITFSDVKDDVHDEKVKTIVVEYEAILNSTAVMENTGNPNTVKLNFSNDPNYKHSGVTNPPNFPGEGDINGVTPESKVNTYTTGVKLTKIKAGDADTKLAGAKFTIRGEALNVVKSEDTYFKKAGTGEPATHYLLKDGTYTTENPVTDDKYASTTKQYIQVTDTNITTSAPKQYFETEGTSDDNGIVKFERMGAGTYYITEIKAPNGYNLLKEPIVVTIAAASSTTKDKVVWTVTKGSEAIASAGSDNLFAFNVENSQGSLLPETGGIGTTIFYAGGTFMLLGAAGLYLNKKRKNAQA